MADDAGIREAHLDLAPTQFMASTIDTPALVVDKRTFEANIAAAEKLVSGTGKRLRPHVKTHRTPHLALAQLGRVTSGLTCSTVGEAEVMVSAGAQNVLVANEIVSARKLERIAKLASRAEVLVAVDSVTGLDGLSAAAQASGSSIGVLVDLDIGLGRCGVGSLEETLRLARAAAGSPGVYFAGLMGFEGRMRSSVPDRDHKIRAAFQILAAGKDAVERRGLKVEVVSAAGTSTIREALVDPCITEIQAGTYALMEPDMEGLALPFNCAVYIVSTVISRSNGHIVVDVGRRSVGTDYGPPISLEPQGKVLSIADEHTMIEWEGRLPDLGSYVRLRPTQIRTTFNLYDRVWLVDEGGMAESISVAARGNSD